LDWGGGRGNVDSAEESDGTEDDTPSDAMEQSKRKGGGVYFQKRAKPARTLGPCAALRPPERAPDTSGEGGGMENGAFRKRSLRGRQMAGALGKINVVMDKRRPHFL